MECEIKLHPDAKGSLNPKEHFLGNGRIYAPVKSKSSRR